MPNQYEIFAELCDDNATWENIRNYPDCSRCRAMLVPADFAAEDATRWRTLRLLLEHPELSFREAAAVLALPLSRVYRYSQPVNLEGDMASRRKTVSRHDFGDGSEKQRSLTARRALRLADFAAAEPLRWQLLRCAYRGNAPVPKRRLAELFGISPARVTRLLRVPHLGYPEDFFPDGISGDIPSEKYRYVF